MHRQKQNLKFVVVVKNLGLKKVEVELVPDAPPQEIAEAPETDDKGAKKKKKKKSDSAESVSEPEPKTDPQKPRPPSVWVADQTVCP